MFKLPSPLQCQHFDRTPLPIAISVSIFAQISHLLTSWCDTWTLSTKRRPKKCKKKHVDRSPKNKNEICILLGEISKSLSFHFKSLPLPFPPVIQCDFVRTSPLALKRLGNFCTRTFVICYQLSYCPFSGGIFLAFLCFSSKKNGFHKQLIFSLYFDLTNFIPPPPLNSNVRGLCNFWTVPMYDCWMNAWMCEDSILGLCILSIAVSVYIHPNQAT